LQSDQYREGRILFAEMYDRLRRFAGAVGPWDMEPDDLLHEALVRTLRLGPLTRLENPEAYLRRTITNIARNWMKRQGIARSAQHSVAARADAAAEPSYPSDLSDLLELDPIGRAVVFLHDIEGHTFAEVGELLGISEGNSRQIAVRARHVLRHQIDQEASS
jgi:RNA polymerase sigma factor (sigma-70 family)